MEVSGHFMTGTVSPIPPEMLLPQEGGTGSESVACREKGRVGDDLEGINQGFGPEYDKTSAHHCFQFQCPAHTPKNSRISSVLILHCPFYKLFFSVQFLYSSCFYQYIFVQWLMDATMNLCALEFQQRKRISGEVLRHQKKRTMANS